MGETDLAEFENTLQKESSPEAEVVVVLTQICFWMIGLTFWSVFSDSARSVSGSGSEARQFGGLTCRVAHSSLGGSLESYPKIVVVAV